MIVQSVRGLLLCFTTPWCSYLDGVGNKTKFWQEMVQGTDVIFPIYVSIVILLPTVIEHYFIYMDFVL